MTVDHLSARLDLRRSSSTDSIRVGLVTTYPPTRCGIGTFSQSLVEAIESPELEVEVIRLVDDRPGPVGEHHPALEIVPDLPIGIRAAARRLNRCDVAIFQHEYGIYGANDGEAILEMVRLVECPRIVVLHTVLEHPSPRQKHILQQLAAKCHVVTISEAARLRLIGGYGVNSSKVTVIPHGASWHPQPPNPAPRRRLVTWGLLGPGKGLERAIEAMARLRDLTPPPLYQIVGRTHPGVVRSQGFAYRRSLEHLVDRLDVGDMVEFVDHYLENDELYDLVISADVVVVPYDNREQISSGVLTEAIAAGRPVVATRFPHAVELLDNGSGIIAEHDSVSLAGAMRELLTQESTYERCARAAAMRSATLAWDNCGERYTSLVRRVVCEPRAVEPIDA